VNSRNDVSNQPTRLRWAQLRLMVIGPLLAAPPEPGELQERLRELADKSWKHPSTGEPTKFGVSTLERWLYAARNNEQNPMQALERKTHALAGQHPSVTEPVRAALRAQHREHPSWSYQLHYDNLGALAEREPEPGQLPSYGSMRRWMKKSGLMRVRRKKRRNNAEHSTPFEAREQRSFEVQHPHALWHLDFHKGSRKVILPDGHWHTAQLLGILDDCTRLCCHLQWYLIEDTQALVHGLSQALIATQFGYRAAAAKTYRSAERARNATGLLASHPHNTTSGLAARRPQRGAFLMPADKLLSLYGLKFNPFRPGAPPDALYVTRVCNGVDHEDSGATESDDG
jgi:hypothetical protein